MQQRSAAKDFETALLEAWRDVGTGKIKAEPALGPFAGFLTLWGYAHDPDPNMAGPAWGTLGELHTAYQWAKTHDDFSKNWKKPRRATRYKDKYVPEKLAHVRDLVQGLWPVLPLVSFLWGIRHDRGWTYAAKTVRIQEYFFMLLCTQPRLMLGPLYDLALEVVTPVLRVRRLGHLDAGVAAMAVMENLERRARPIARYKATAKTAEGAATAVRRYMVGAIRRRLEDVLPKIVRPEFDVSRSTLERWRKQGILPENLPHFESIKKAKEQRQKHVTEGRFSLAMVARKTGWSRPRVTKALHQAEAEDGFVAEVKGGTTLLTQSQVKRVKALLGRKARPPA